MPLYLPMLEYPIKHWSVAMAVALVSLVAPPTVVAEEMRTKVTAYQIIGNTILSDIEIFEVVGGRQGQLSFSDIQKTAQALQAKYRAAGYGAVVVQVPDQTLSGGLVRLEVIEGKLSQVQVTGNSQFSKSNVLRSLPALRLSETPSLFSLDRQLLMVNENPAKSARVVFQPGEKPGQVEALAIVEEQPAQRWTFLSTTLAVTPRVTTDSHWGM
jgi:hemolysin activation/secretion protein